jgi:hypothetical protein
MNKERLFLAALVLLLLAPHCFIGLPPFGLLPAPGLPRLFGGDEQHYLVIINSLLNDGDLDLSNNYAAVDAGSEQAGVVWARMPTTHRITHHTVVLVEGRPVHWKEFLPPAAPLPPGTPEYSTHQSAIAFLLAPVLFPLRGTTCLEPAALLCSGLATVAGMFFFRMLLGGLTTDRFTINAVTAVTFLATPIWFYGRSLFMESFLLCFLIGAYALALRKEWNVLPGVLLGCAVQLKPHYTLFALPLLADRALHRRWLGVVGLAAPLAVSTVLLLFTYAQLYGSPFTPPQLFVVGNTFNGLVGLLFSGKHGLLAFVPVALIAIACWPSFLSRQRRYALLLGSGFLMFLFLMASYHDWAAGICYGPRHLTPTIPLLFAALVQLREYRFVRIGVVKVALLVLVVVSVLVNARGVFYYSEYWDKNPYGKSAESVWSW